MDASQFTDPTAGRLVPTIKGQLAFVPAPLPPKIDMGPIAVTFGAAMQALGELKGACRRLQNPYVLVRPLQRREALTSSAMEGTFSSEDNLVLVGIVKNQKPDFAAIEVRNYLDALHNAIISLPSLPISHRTIKDAHRTLMSGVGSQRGSHRRPGEYKQAQNWIDHREIADSRFIPPPPSETQECMDQLEAYLNREDQTLPSPLVDLALVHYQFETIHPFDDGNGRLGRMLISLMSMNSGLLDMPVLYMSPSIERDKDKYIDLMFNVSTTGDWASWLEFFFEKVCESATDTISLIDRLIDLNLEYRELVSNSVRSANALQIVDFVFESPALAVSDVKVRTGLSDRASRNLMDKLVELEILVEIPELYPKIFLAPRILTIASD
ncbi:MAG: Fic family protein [Pseudomonadota bacterium]